MTERQIRLSNAGLVLLRGTAVVGGIFGAFFLVTALSGQQRVIFLVLVGICAMPILLVGLAGSVRWGAMTFLGLALANAMVFVDADAYLALAFVAAVGMLLNLGPRMSLRPTGGGSAY